MIHKNIKTLRDFLRIWFYWKKYALMCAIGVFCIILIYAIMARPRYTSFAKVVLLPRTSEGAIITSGSDEKLISPIRAEDVNTEVELMESDDILRATVASFNREGMNLSLNGEEKGPIPFLKNTITCAFAQPPQTNDTTNKYHTFPVESEIRQLKGALDIKTKAMSNMITLGLTARDPQAAARVLNRYLDVYIQHHNKVFTLEQGFDFFKTQADTFRKELDASENTLTDYQKEYDIVDLEMQNETNLENLARMERELKEVELNIDEVKVRGRILSNALSRDNNNMAITKEMQSIPVLAEFEKQLVPMLLKRGEILSKYTTESPEYTRIEDQINCAFNERRKEILKTLKADSIEMENLAALRSSLRNQIVRTKADLHELNKKYTDMKNLQRAVSLQEQNYLLYASKSEDARIFAERMRHNLSNVSIADRADVPMVKSFPKRSKILTFGLFVACVLFIFTPFFIEAFDSRLKTDNDIETLLRIPVVGTVPYLPDK